MKKLLLLALIVTGCNEVLTYRDGNRYYIQSRCIDSHFIPQYVNKVLIMHKVCDEYAYDTIFITNQSTN